MSSSTSALKDDLILLKTRLETIESQLTGQMKEIENREQKWKSMEERCDKIYCNQTDIVRFNVGGEKFATSVNTLLRTPNTLFCKLIESGRLDLKEEIFFDRSAEIFPFILDFLRTKDINYKNFSKDQLAILKEDAEYYNIYEITSHLNVKLQDIEFVSFTSSGSYIYNGKTAGTNKVEDLKDKSCMKGICASSPGVITIVLNAEFEFETMEMGGWKGDSSLWGADNGAGATISTSVDGENWKVVGTVPSGFGYDIKTVKLSRSSGKFIKFDKTSFLGIGYLNINKINSE